MTESDLKWSGFHVPSLINDYVADAITTELQSHKGVFKVECDRFLNQVVISHDNEQITVGQLHRLLAREDPKCQKWVGQIQLGSNGGGSIWLLAVPAILSAILLVIGSVLHLVANLKLNSLANWFDATVPNNAQTCYLVAAIIAGAVILKQGIEQFVSGNLSVYHLVWVLIPALFATGHSFEAAVLAVCINICVWILERAIRKSTNLLYSQTPRFPTTCRSLASKNSQSIERETICLEPGDLVEVWPGEQIPADSTITQGESAISMQYLTGDANAIDTGVGDTVYAGSINIEKAIQVEVIRRRFDSVLPGCLRTLHRAAGDRIALQLRSQKFVAILLSMLVIASGVVMLVGPILPGQSWDQWLYRGLVLLSLTCPFAILLRSSTVVIQAVARAAANGIFVGSAVQLDQLCELNVIAFEKGGCITYPELNIERVSLLAGDIDVNELMTLALSVEVGVEHPISDAISKYAREHQIQPRSCTDRQLKPGIGVEGTVDGQKIWVGNLRIPREHGILRSDEQSLIASIADEGFTPILIGRGPEIIGVIGLTNPIRSGVETAIKRLKRMGVSHSVLLSGDHSGVTDKLAEQLGFDRSTTELLSAEKVSLLELIRRDYGAAIAVGDGVVDAEVLQAAAVGIAMNVRHKDATSNAGIAVLHDDATQVAGLMDLARQVQANLMRGNMVAITSKIGVAALAIVGLGFVWLAMLVETLQVLMAVYSVSKVEFQNTAV